MDGVISFKRNIGIAKELEYLLGLKSCKLDYNKHYPWTICAFNLHSNIPSSLTRWGMAIDYAYDPNRTKHLRIRAIIKGLADCHEGLTISRHDKHYKNSDECVATIISGVYIQYSESVVFETKENADSYINDFISTISRYIESNI